MLQVMAPSLAITISVVVNVALIISSIRSGDALKKDSSCKNLILDLLNLVAIVVFNTFWILTYNQTCTN